ILSSQVQILSVPPFYLGGFMKVIQIYPSLNQGGIERCVINLANYITQQNIENKICSNGGILISDLTNTQHLTLPAHKKSFIHNLFVQAKK
ncbi:MAG: hypothetical protein CFH44_00001, partial [Proteobacteria bacterium]